MMKKVSITLACLLALCLCFAVGAQNDASDSISLPAALVQGHTYNLCFPDAELTVNGQPCEGSFTAEGSQAALVYTGADGSELGAYTLPVVNTKDSADHCAYFYDPSGAASVKENTNDVVLSAAKDTQVSFLGTLPADNFGINLVISEETSHFNALTLKLTDCADAQNSLSIRIDLAAGEIKIGDASYNPHKLPSTYQLRYKNNVRQLYISDKPAIACEVNDQGNKFEGFSGGVYLTLEFEGVAGSSEVAITRLCNQPMGHKDSGAADSTEPVIAITSQLSSRLYMQDTFRIPEFAAYDVFSNVVESSVSVELPDGTTASEDFTVTQYGRYKITFSAKDSKGNKVKSSKTVYVNDDIAPELQVAALEKTSYKLGSAVTFPTYTASDNLEAYYVDVILILPNSEVRLLTHDASGEITYTLTDSALYPASFRNNETSFKADKTGTYTLRYVAYDDQFNKTVQELTFTVK